MELYAHRFTLSMVYWKDKQNYFFQMAPLKALKIIKMVKGLGSHQNLGKTTGSNQKYYFIRERAGGIKIIFPG